MDHGRAEVLVPHREIAVEIDAHHHGQAILPGQKRADVAGKRLGQHGNGPIGQVQAAAAAARFFVDRRVLA
jgi:hypothetical protein